MLMVNNSRGEPGDSFILRLRLLLCNAKEIVM